MENVEGSEGLTKFNLTVNVPGELNNRKAHSTASSEGALWHG